MYLQDPPEGQTEQRRPGSRLADTKPKQAAHLKGQCHERRPGSRLADTKPKQAEHLKRQCHDRKPGSQQTSRQTT